MIFLYDPKQVWFECDGFQSVNILLLACAALVFDFMVGFEWFWLLPDLQIGGYFDLRFLLGYMGFYMILCMWLSASTSKTSDIPSDPGREAL